MRRRLRLLLPRRKGLLLRPPRRQRRGQVDDADGHHEGDQVDHGRRLHRRPFHFRRLRGRVQVARRGDAVQRAVGLADVPRASAPLRRSARCGRRGEARRRRHRSLPAPTARGQVRKGPVRRAEAQALRRHRRHGRPGMRAPGRAVGWSRPFVAQEHVGGPAHDHGLEVRAARLAFGGRGRGSVRHGGHDGARQAPQAGHGGALAVPRRIGRLQR
mmetsp:Transcript_8802/g.29010  ORF Transcript_8802/g.29010 Transcript_8802/m.29010 type:complete len:215 (+) Transcript_8802:3272-3916(+)